MQASGYQKFGDRWHRYATAPMFDDAGIEIKKGCFALPEIDLDVYVKGGQGTKYCQFFNLVLDGLQNVKHVFKGLRRGLYNDKELNGDKCKLIYTWKPDFDVEWVGGRMHNRSAPRGSIFAVFVSPNLNHRQEYPDVDFFIGHWTWISEDSVLAGAPVEWVERFDCKIWSRSDV